MGGATTDLAEDFRDLLRAFADHGVRFLVVGAYALAVHGGPARPAILTSGSSQRGRTPNAPTRLDWADSMRICSVEHRLASAAVAAICIANLGGCVVQAHSMKVVKERPGDIPHFSRVAIPTFENAVGPQVPPGTTEQLALAIRQRLSESHRDAFDQVADVPTNEAQELIVRGRIIAFEPGKGGVSVKVMGVGAGEMELDITILEGQTGRVFEQFTTTAIITRSVQKEGAMDMHHMSAGPAAYVALRIAEYGKED